MEFLECIRGYLESEDDAPGALREILLGAHTVLLDNGDVYDTMKRHEHARPRRSSHYASNHYTQYEITGHSIPFSRHTQTKNLPEMP